MLSKSNLWVTACLEGENACAKAVPYADDAEPQAFYSLFLPISTGDMR
jgi:hypothetical protein